MAEPPRRQQIRWHPVRDVAALHQAALDWTLAAAAQAIAARGRFAIVLAGGETPRAVYERLRAAPTDWQAWHVFFGDERCTPPDDAQRNSRMAAMAWLDHVAIPPSQVHPIPAELGPVEAARRYAGTLAAVGDFDLVLLGLGEDGHTGSLFPGHDGGAAAASPTVLPVDGAPKPPPERVSLSAHRFGQARETLFLVAGEGKRDAVRRWRRGEAIPASLITPASGVDVLVESALLT